ncbi:PEP-CTERM sorting domain-containing protein [Bythopirellula polymerisocia]|uniref:Ice-binding protein C-terminal domain-containing protein n=1 Tax=Bythopirellula polymerisocia TaxID=2528003 RepID=A0A5C6CV45_9BACT|nr:PEP-CTERM sorting domain-containing protein [Bythopirellula polymerisocia]TWU28460.1 hypothetical protein Pla144_17500 [Bythopirellula polymerisocia]
MLQIKIWTTLTQRYFNGLFLFGVFVTSNLERPAVAEQYALTYSFAPPVTATQKWSFGNAVALHGNQVLVGGSNSRDFVDQVFLFDATTGGLVHTFDDPGFVPGEQIGFGNAIAVSDQYVAIGDNGSGRVLLYDALTGLLIHEFNRTVVSGSNRFGRSVSLDNNRLLVGDNLDSTQGDRQGRAHLFDTISGNLLQSYDDPTATRLNGFGVAVTSDIDRVLVGADEGDKAFLFSLSTGNLLQTFDIGLDGQFGLSVAMSEDLVLIGAPSVRNGDSEGVAYLLDSLTGNVLQTFHPPGDDRPSKFGISVALVGSRALIGERGQAHLFDAITGQVVQTFFDPTPNELSDFGTQVAMDGNRILIGGSIAAFSSPLSGEAHLYSAVPEPTSLLLGSVGLAGVLLVRRRSKNPRESPLSTPFYCF